MTPVLALIESNTTGTGRLFAAAARARGLRPVLFTTAPSRYPWAADDGIEVEGADTTDPEAVALAYLRVARPDPLAGIVTSSEYAVTVAARAAARLGVPGAAPGAVEQCRDKRRQRAALQRAGVPVPSFAAVGSVTTAIDAALGIGFPVVCKPVDGTGSRGVRFCPDQSSLAAHSHRLLARRYDERGQRTLPWILVEEYVEGHEVSVETFGHRRVEVVGVADKHLGPLPAFVETGHDVPATPSAGVVEVARRAVEALGVGWGPAHTEVRLSPSGPVVVEVNPRLAGGQIPVLVRLATGVDLIGATIDLAVGETPTLPAPGPGFASIRFLVAPFEGRVLRVGGKAGAAATPGVVDVVVSTTPGQRVGGTDSFLDRVGHVITVAPTAGEARTAAERALSALELELTATDAPVAVR